MPIMIPAMGLPLAKVRKSDNLMKLPALAYRGFLSNEYPNTGLEILAATHKKEVYYFEFFLYVREERCLKGALSFDVKDTKP